MKAMIMKPLLALIALILAAPALAAGAPQPSPLVVLRSNVMLEGETVLLGDLFEPAGEAADTIVAYAPPPGRRAIFDANWLARVAQRFQLEWRPRSRYDRAVVERLSTRITGAEVEAELRRELVLMGFGEDHEIELSNGSLHIDIPVDQPPTVAVSNLSVDERSQRFVATVSAPAGHPQARRLNVAGRVYKVVELPVLRRNMMPGEVIDQEDLSWVRVRVAQVRTTTATEAGQLVGTEPRRPLRAGQPVRMIDVRAPLLVRKGDFVTMIYDTPAMRLTATGRALTNGSKGDSVRVLNTSTNKTIEAIADGPNEVLVVVAGRMARN